jgi:hypothetical protein
LRRALGYVGRCVGRAGQRVGIRIGGLKQKGGGDHRLRRDRAAQGGAGIDHRSERRRRRADLDRAAFRQHRGDERDIGAAAGRIRTEPGVELRRLQERVRDLERLLGRKTMENEVVKEALDLARAKKRSCRRALCRRTVPDEEVTDTLGLARSNIVERVKGMRPKRGRKPVTAMRRLGSA